MSNLVELITAPNTSAGGTSDHLKELVQRIEADDSVTLKSKNDHFVCFTVPQDALDSFLTDLKSKLIVEVNQSISLPQQPGPYSGLPSFDTPPIASDES